MRWCLQCGCMAMRGGCGILLSEGFAVSLGHRKISDLDFSYVLVQPSLILHCAWYAIVEPLDGFSSVTVPAAPVVALQHGQPQDPLGCSTTFLAASACSCSCAGGVGWAAAFSFAFSVPRLRRLAWRWLLGASPCEVAFRLVLLALFVSGYVKEVVTSLCLGVLWCLRTPQDFSDFGCSYVWVWLHLLLRFAGCGFECFLPCWILSRLSGCTPFSRCDIAV